MLGQLARNGVLLKRCSRATFRCSLSGLKTEQQQLCLPFCWSYSTLRWRYPCQKTCHELQTGLSATAVCSLLWLCLSDVGRNRKLSSSAAFLFCIICSEGEIIRLQMTEFLYLLSNSRSQVFIKYNLRNLLLMWTGDVQLRLCVDIYEPGRQTRTHHLRLCKLQWHVLNSFPEESTPNERFLHRLITQAKTG